jgi:predicted dehydrogenase
MNRRYFIKSAVATAVAAGPSRSANDKILAGAIGLNGRGRALASSAAALPGVEVAYLCDVDQDVLQRAAGEFEKKFGKRPKLVSDLRRILDDGSVDVITIGTPDHWHAPATILGCMAGKDVYVEKPCSHNLREGRLMVEAARKYKRIVQHGTQNRSSAIVQWLIEYVRSGNIGKVLMAKAWDVQLRRNIGHKPDGPVPPGVDYDTWIGPAAALPFSENRYHYNWHWHWNYGTGDMGNDGVHQIDMARWALGVDYPDRVSGLGRKLFFDDDQQTPDTMTVTFDHRDKILMFEMRIWNPYRMEGVDNALAIYGSEGMVQIGRGYKVFDRKGNVVPVEAPGGGQGHMENFMECVRSRKTPNAEIEIGHRSTTYAHLGNIVARTGRSLQFDGSSETIIGDQDANGYLRRQYRQHWATPRNV